ncbi:MAG: carboxypeptidase regulatory-like domain-containing protein [Phycisphaerae bacterium]|nr:carboxypeptidase regulatory-like domain-containing protein [Phycisphaerae bacterium]
MNTDKACPNLRDHIAALVLGELKTDTAEKLHRHILRCQGCRGLYESMSSEERAIEQTFDALARRGREVESAAAQRNATRGSSGLEAVLRGLRSRRVIGLAAAAAVLVVTGLVLFLALHSRDQGTAGPAARQGQRPPDPRLGPAGQEDQVLAREQAEVHRLTAARDVDGLLELLDSGQWQTKIAVAAGLGRIGDADAVPALSRYVGQWTGDPAENPFGGAVDQITQRTTIVQPGEASVQPTTPALEGRSQTVKAPPATQAVLCGRITDAVTGEPVTDARVEISLSRYATAQVDANGLYRFDKIERDGSYRVRVYSKDHVGITEDSQIPVVDLRTGTQTIRDFRLGKACRIVVQVTDEQGTPIKDVALRVSPTADAHGRDIGRGIYGPPKTDPNGIVHLGGLAPSDQAYRITATHAVAGPWVQRGGEKVRQSVWDYAPGHVAVTLKDPNVVETAEIVLQKGVDVQGYCEYADGVPASGLGISAHPDWWLSAVYPPIVDIDPNGGFTLPQIVPGRYTLHVHISTGDGTGISFGVGQMEWPLQDPPLVVKVPRKSPQSLASISGRITFIGTPVPSSMSIAAVGPSLSEGVSLSRGQRDFTIDSLEPGTYALRFSGQGILEKTIEGVVAPTSGLEVQLVCGENGGNARPVLQGVVVRADTRQPVTRFKARAAKVRHLGGPSYVQTDRWAEFTNGQGQFRIETVGPGVYQVQVAAEGMAPAWSSEVNTEESSPVTVAMTTGGSIAGMVMDEYGQPVKDATVIPLSKACGTMPHIRDVFVSTEGAVKTDAGGVFTLGAIPAGLESIQVVHDRYCHAVKKDIPVQEGQMTQGVDVILSGGGSVQGQVFDPQGRPEPGVTLYVQDASGYLMAGGDEQAGRLATAVTDANGLYRVQHLPAQVCYVQRSSTPWASGQGVVRRAVLPEAGTARRLDFGGLPLVTGQVVVRGMPLTDARVSLGDPLSRSSGIFECAGMTDGQGRFRLSGVPAGRYGLYYEHPTQRGDWIKAATMETSGQDLDLGMVPGPGAEVRIHVNAADPGRLTQPGRVVLEEGTLFWGPASGPVESPTQAGAPYVARGVQPGTHTAVVHLSGRLMLRREITVQAGQRELDVTVQVPAGTAVLTGDLKSDGQQTLVLIRSDGQVMAYVYAEGGPQYRIEGLPAGTYSICSAPAQDDKAPLLTINLAEGQAKRIDIDTSQWTSAPVGLLFVQVVAPDGIPSTTSRAWLEGLGKRIEPVQGLSEGHTFAAQPGLYMLHVTQPGLVPHRGSVEVLPADLSRGGLQYKRSPVLVRLSAQ